jgi:hypothetical protein
MSRTFDRVSHFDERSRSYGIAARVAPGQRVRRIWTPPAGRIDQGQEGHCVGFGWANELATSPIRIPNVTDAFAHGMFYGAQGIDREEGRNFADGATVLAGAKYTKNLGFMDEYRWAFTIDEIIDGVIGEGPCVIGVDWYDGMYDTRPSGLVDVSGTIVGGHCITIIGYHPGIRLRGEGWLKRHEVFVWLNSWGTGYGKEGIGYVKVEDLESRLMPNGEFCFPVNRRRAA